MHFSYFNVVFGLMFVFVAFFEIKLIFHNVEKFITSAKTIKLDEYIPSFFLCTSLLLKNFFPLNFSEKNVNESDIFDNENNAFYSLSSKQ